MRAEASRKTISLEDSAEPSSPAVTPGGELEHYLARLPDTQREAITLFYLEDRSMEDVARLLDLPEGTVKSRLHRARRALGQMMEKE